jgi:predicted nicotinamide N-methyase
VGGSARAFVLRHSRLQPVPGLDDVRLHLSDDIYSVWGAIQKETAESDAPIPFWAFAWGGGLAIASFLRDRRDFVAGRRVLDVASGSGLDAIAAVRAGAAEVTAADIDPYSIAAIELNAKANRVRLDIVREDVLVRDPPSDVDVILAGDCWYEETFGTRISAWLVRAAGSGTQVLIGDPGRRYLDHANLRELATYDVRSTTDLEDMGRTRASVYELVAPQPAGEG